MQNPPPPRQQRSTLAIVSIVVSVVAVLGLIAVAVLTAIGYPRLSRAPVEDRNAVAPAADRNAVAPAADRVAVAPAAGRSATVPAVDRSATAPAADRNAACKSNLKQLSLGLLMYAQDHDNRFPPAESWADAVRPYVRNRDVYECPAGGGYAYNSELSNIALGDIRSPWNCPMLFDSDAGNANSNDPVTSFVKRHRESGSGVSVGNVAWADGHVKGVISPPDARTGLVR